MKIPELSLICVDLMILAIVCAQLALCVWGWWQLSRLNNQKVQHED